MCDSLFRRITTHALLLFSVLFLFAPNGKAGETSQKLVPGVYEFLMLAVDPGNEVLGFYRESQGEGVVKTCSFFLKGRMKDGQANIASWSGLFHGPSIDEGKVFPGLLKNKGGNDVSLKIERGPEHPGCSLVLMPQISDEGLVLERTNEAKWVSLKIVKNDRAPLFSEPVSGKKTKSYFIKNDVLGVVSMNGEWINVEFPREGKQPVKGWVKSNDVQDLQPPQT